MLDSLRSKISQVSDIAIRDNFQAIIDDLGSSIFSNFDGRILTVDSGVAIENCRIPHKLGFTPTDIIKTFETGVGTAIINYDFVDSTFIDITITGACKSRIIVGRFKTT